MGVSVSDRTAQGLNGPVRDRIDILEVRDSMLRMDYKHDDSKFFEAFQNIDVKKAGLWVRWLWPDRVEEQEIDRELKALAEAGIAGAEIGLHAMAKTWGTDEYFQSLIWAMRAAKKYGLKLDFFLTVGTLCLPQWALPLDCDAAEKMLFYYDSRAVVPAGSDGHGIPVTLGVPRRSSTTINARLVAVSYAKFQGQQDNFAMVSEEDAGTLYADSLHLEQFRPESPKTLWELLGKDTEQDLLPCGYNLENHKFSMDGLEAHPELFHITVDLPANTGAEDAEYVVFAYWEVPSDKTFGGVTQYCCDHYSLLGTRAVTDYYDRAVEKFPELGELFGEVGRAFFGDSLENNGNWTMKILDQYKTMFGGDFTKYLYTVANGPWRVRPEMSPPPAEDTTGVVKGKPVAAGPKPPFYGLPFTPPDFSKGKLQYVSEHIQQLRNSYYEAMTRSFIDNHILVYQEWADKYGMDIRYQSTYGQKQFMAQVSAHIDMAETESLAYRDEVDGYRGQAGAVHMQKNGSKILSSEQGENFENQFHSTTWGGDFLWRSNRFYVSGGNQLVYHVYAYAKYDESMTHGNGNMVWPGFRPQPNVGDNLQWNRPTMGYMQDYSKYIARTQLLLRTGEAKLDAAIYYHCYNNDRWDFDAFYHDDRLEKAGYSYEFLDPSFFDLEKGRVENGVFAPDGPGYRVLLFQNQRDLPVEAAEKLLGYAKQGLPMVFAGAVPEKAAYFGGPEADRQVREIVAELLTLPTVRRVADSAMWPEAMRELGVAPSVEPGGAALMYAHRAAEDADYFFLYNQEKYFDQEKMWLPLRDIDTEIALKGARPGRKPYLLNLWSGAITPVQRYTEADGMVWLHLALKGNDTCAIVLAEDGWYHGEAAACGEKTVVDIVALEHWSLTLQSHEPGEKALCGDDLTDTKVVTLTAGEIGPAKPWTRLELPGGCHGADISGVGVYTTEVFWDSGEGLGAELDLGAVCDLYRLTVNGREVPGANPVHPVQDITALLRAGRNEITVEVASNFFHAERSRDYLCCNWVEQKPYTAWDFGILGTPVLKIYKYQA